MWYFIEKIDRSSFKTLKISLPRQFLIYLDFTQENKKLTCWARRRGLVVRVKIHVQEVVSSIPGPAVETIYHAPLNWIKSMKA